MDSNYDRYGDAGSLTQDAAQEYVQSEAESGATVSGAPYWENRELTDEYTRAERVRPGVDLPFLVITLLILMIGLIMVLSASFARGYYTTGEPMNVFTRQFIFAVSGLAIMIVVSYFNLKALSRWSYILLIFSIFLLVIVLFFGTKVNGSKRWLGFGGTGSSFSFQPSEIAKLALIMAYAKWICVKGPWKIRTFKTGVAPFIVITGIIFILLVLEPHVSASITVLFLTVIIMFAGGVRLRWFIPVVLVAAVVIGALVFIKVQGATPEGDAPGITEKLSQIPWGGGKLEYVGRRIDAWLNPETDPMGDGFQARQSLYAVGSGGMLGQGLGQSRQKYLYLPEEHNDYIFAIVCEELGYIGAMLILMLFVLLIIRGFWLALHAKTRYGALVTIGIMSLLAIQVFLNVAVVTNLLPVTGVSLPFFSTGGTALWIQLFQMGIVLAVSREIPKDIARRSRDGRGE